jgi:hypothetical protein
MVVDIPIALISIKLKTLDKLVFDKVSFENVFLRRKKSKLKLNRLQELYILHFIFSF